jgi:hypothetical protein
MKAASAYYRPLGDALTTPASFPRHARRRPGIHALLVGNEDVVGRNKSGHDDKCNAGAVPMLAPVRLRGNDREQITT